ncbi:MAG: HEAT repeat domain-containing protein [Planctomycetes bacterium]|nr:HEAT repeat domain-containing protein [Planctomycetota bacterium]
MLDAKEIQKHILALNEGDHVAQREAIHFLRHLEPQEWATAPLAVFHSVVGALQQQLRNGTKSPLVYREIATLLGNMGRRAKSVVPQLIELLQEGMPDSVREAAATALGNVGEEARGAVDRLIVLSDNHTALAMHAVRALGGIGCADQRVRSTLLGLWLSSNQSQNSQVQLAIALCKLQIDAKGLLGFLTKNLVASQDEAIRKSAAEGLASCNKEDLDVVPALLTAALGDKNEVVRQVAQAALDHLKLSNEEAVHLCSLQLANSSLAETALRRSGPLAITALIQALGKEKPATRVKAAQILGSLGELAAAAIPALTTALSHKDPDVRLAAAKSLWNINKNADVVVPVLVKLLEDKRPVDLEDGESRRRFFQTVIEALWRIGPPAKAAVPVLMDKTKDKNRLVSESAHNALRKIEPTAAK